MIKTSLEKTLLIIKQNKLKVFFIFFLQIIFFIALSLIVYNTIIPSMQYAKEAMDYYDKINVTEDTGMFGYLGENPLVIYQSYKNMMYYLKMMVLYSVLAFIVINGLIWAITDNLINKKNRKQFLHYFTNFGILTIIFIAILYLTIFKTLKSSLVDIGNSLLPFVGILILFIVLIYFLFIGLALIDKRKPKEIPKLILKIGILKFPYVILTYLINFAIILLLSYLIFLTIESNMILLSIILILFVLSFVFTRLFLIISINNLTKKI